MSDAELRRRVEALRRPLAFAASDSFRGIAKIRDLGATIAGACDRILSVAEDDVGLRAWRRAIETFDEMAGPAKAVEVARGLRLCHMLVGAPRTPDRPATTRRAAASVGTAREALMAPTESLPGIGPALAGRLAERGIETVEDLLWLVPRRYDDVRVVERLGDALAEAEPGQRIAVEGEVASVHFARRGRHRWVDLRLEDSDGDARLVVRWFNAHGSMAKRFPRGSRVALSGKLQRRGGGAEMANPDVLFVTLPDGETRVGAAGIIPRYADVPGVPAATLRKAMAAAAERGSQHLIDGVPASIAARHEMVPLGEALECLHRPPQDMSVAEVEALNRGEGAWHRRLAFDELFVLGLAVARRRRERRDDVAVPCEIDPVAAARLLRVFPFELTAAQLRCVDEVACDLAAAVPMNRLLQGDVGSGKTAVAFAAAAQVIAARRQVALMAPTEILAEQHRAGLGEWAEALGVRVELLTASTPRGVRASMLSMLAAGKIDMLIGTHSLLSEGVGFAHLGLAIVDEQHRFGVAQRVTLRAKGDEGSPHLLVMTATPIPRTLALTVYGDLDVSIIDELPPGREPSVTRVLAGAKGRERAYRIVAKRVARGERAFVVCPLVEPIDDDEVRSTWASATGVAEELAARLAPVRVGLVHGRMASDDRDRVMAQFRGGELDVLVATTVIEVGVDIPEATVMVIEDAHRFGLSQLHQLRGRVGRGGGSSECLLLSRGRRTEGGARRLEVMAATTDGFRIAEEDLALRGPGDLLGKRQAGLPKLRFGDLQRHTELLLLARREADRLLAEDPALARPENRGAREVLAMRAGEDVFGAESG